MPINSSSYQIQSLNILRRYASTHSLQSSPLEINNNINISRNKQFIPFIQQRDLGKIIYRSKSLTRIQQMKKASNQYPLDMITFKNFKKLYNIQKQREQMKYASKTRMSQQKDLLKQDQWIVKSIKKQQQDKKTYLSTPKIILRKQKQFRVCSCEKQLKLRLKNKSKFIYPQKQSDQKYKKAEKQTKFQKINLQLYKKLSSSIPPHSTNPQLNILFEHYVQVSQLNQNIRRQILTKKKFNIFRRE